MKMLEIQTNSNQPKATSLAKGYANVLHLEH